MYYKADYIYIKIINYMCINFWLESDLYSYNRRKVNNNIIK